MDSDCVLPKVSFSTALNLSSGVFTSTHVCLGTIQLEKLWHLFDFDGNGGMDEVEAEIMLESVVRG